MFENIVYFKILKKYIINPISEKLYNFNIIKYI